MVNKIDITGTKAFNYLRSQLNIGKQLSRLLITDMIEKGRVYALVPDRISEDALYDFENGGIYEIENAEIGEGKLVAIPNNATPVLLHDIAKFVNDKANTFILIEEPVAKPSDPWVLHLKIDYLRLENEMYYFFDKNNISIANLESAFKVASGFYFLCTLGSVEEDIHRKLKSIKEIDLPTLQDCTKGISSFYVKAYDGEGYLLWTIL